VHKNKKSSFCHISTAISNQLKYKQFHFLSDSCNTNVKIPQHKFLEIKNIQILYTCFFKITGQMFILRRLAVVECRFEKLDFNLFISNWSVTGWQTKHKTDSRLTNNRQHATAVEWKQNCGVEWGCSKDETLTEAVKKETNCGLGVSLETA
jgi:hypothetical protein